MSCEDKYIMRELFLDSIAIRIHDPYRKVTVRQMLLLLPLPIVLIDYIEKSSYLCLIEYFHKHLPNFSFLHRIIIITE